MPTATARITVTQPDMNGARCRALFSSGLQPSDALTADMVATAISRAVRQFGIGGCAGRMAQEFGDHPDAAARRMRWARQLIAWGQQPTNQAWLVPFAGIEPTAYPRPAAALFSYRSVRRTLALRWGDEPSGIERRTCRPS